MDDPTPPPTYSIGELAELGGVSRRTVRFYVQRGLLPPPTGLGRGSHYTAQHLDTLIQIRRLQESGVPLDEIPDRLAGRPPAPASPRAEAVHLSVWTRIELGDGIELHLRGRRLTTEQAGALATHLRQLLAEGDPP